MDQEEVFIVVEGEATFETMDGEVAVGEDEVIRFAPGEFQSGKNDSEERVVAFALGAPRDSEDVRIPLECPECSHGDRRPMIVDNREVLVCPNCGVESAAECPECGQNSMRAILSGDTEKPVGVCRNCGAESMG
jgi:transcription elongation factor Elf1